MATKNKVNAIREELENQLKARNLTQPYYIDLIDTYCSFYKMAELLKLDIEERGVNVEYNNGGGQKGRKKNESLDELRKTNTQMMNILRELGLRAADIVVEDDEDEGI